MLLYAFLAFLLLFVVVLCVVPKRKRERIVLLGMSGGFSTAIGVIAILKPELVEWWLALLMLVIPVYFFIQHLTPIFSGQWELTVKERESLSQQGGS